MSKRRIYRFRVLTGTLNFSLLYSCLLPRLIAQPQGSPGTPALRLAGPPKSGSIYISLRKIPRRLSRRQRESTVIDMKCASSYYLLISPKNYILTTPVSLQECATPPAHGQRSACSVQIIDPTNNSPPHVPNRLQLDSTPSQG